MSHYRFPDAALLKAESLLATVPYYPRDQAARLSVMDFLDSACPSLEALAWLCSTYANRAREWGGLSDLRGMLCSRFLAADGDNTGTFCQVPGFTPQDFETVAAARDLPLLESGAAPGELLLLVAPAVKSPPSAAPLPLPSTAAAERPSLAELERELAAAPRRELPADEIQRRLREVREGLQRTAPERPPE